MLRRLLLYSAMIATFGGGIGLILHLGAREEAGRPGAVAVAATDSPAHGVASPAAAPAGATGVAAQLRASLQQPLPLLLLQVIVIVLAARCTGAAFLWIHQPPVVGEMVAGILLGPSLLGALWPATQTFLFPASSMGALRLLSQIGVILFMFVVGIDLDVAHLRQKADAAVLVSHASILTPFFLGSVLALLIYRELAPVGVSFVAFTLFLGVAMSITAFPVLARILEERGLSRTQLGSTALACAAVDDVTAWCLLALVVTIAKAEALSGALATALLALAFIGLLLFGLRPRMGRWVGEEVGGEGRVKGLIALTLVFVFACALTTEVIGIHALFGAFLAGVAMPPHSAIRDLLKRRLEAFSSVLLLPLFFAITGLRTQIGLLVDLRSWLLAAAVVAVAVAGKLGGSMLAARVTGLPWSDAFALGALMNTRGLIELIVLNVGYDLGILSGRIFAMMVLMALGTTLMTAPLVAASEHWRKRAAAAPPVPRPEAAA